MDFLTVTTPDGNTYEYALKDSRVRLGRGSTNELVLADPGASRLHAEIVRRPDGYALVDLGSKNGVLLNDQRLEGTALLAPGDRITVGRTVFVFGAGGAAASAPQPLPAAAGGRARTPSSAPTTPGILRPGVAEEVDFPANIEATVFCSTEGLPSDRTISLPPGATMPGVSQAQSERVMRLLVEADETMAFHHPLESILEAVMDLAHQAVDYERGLLMHIEAGRPVPRVVRNHGAARGRPVAYSRTIVERVLRTREAILSSNAPAELPGVQSIVDQEIGSVMCVPLWSGRALHGLIYVDSPVRRGLFTAEVLHVLSFLAGVAAARIENAQLFAQTVEAQVATERRQKELQEAMRIQKRFLPSVPPAASGYTIDGESLPCDEVGGDCFDYIPLGDGRLGIGLGDVAGHGLPAALMMSNFLASLRALSGFPLPPAEMIARLNSLLCGCIPDDRYVTFFYGVLDPASHHLQYVNAGHPPPWLVRRGGGVTRLGGGNLFLGSFPGLTYASDAVRIEPGDVLVCCSDGVTETTDPSGSMFGEERLLEAVAAEEGAGARSILDAVLASVECHAGGAPYQDDLTLVVVRRDG